MEGYTEWLPGSGLGSVPAIPDYGFFMVVIAATCTGRRHGNDADRIASNTEKEDCSSFHEPVLTGRRTTCLFNQGHLGERAVHP